MATASVYSTCLRACMALTMAMIAWAWAITAASAHASLAAAEPPDGSVIDAAPAAFSLTFSEPVSPLSLRLVEPDGTSLALDRFELKDRMVEIEVPAGLGDGTHVLSWRVISADGHPVGGSVVFSIGEASAAPPLVAEEADWTVRAGILASRVALYLGLFIGVGCVFASRWLLGGARHGRNAALAALGIGLLGVLASIGFQGLDALGAPVSRIAEPAVWSTGMTTSLGYTAVAAIVAFAVALAGLLGRGPVASLSSLAALILAGIALALSGHASAAEPQWLMRPAVSLHAAAITFWVGALIPLGLALKRGDNAAVPALRRFSATIPYVVVVLIAAGLVLAIVQVQKPGALFNTAYGQVFLVKLVLLVGLFLLAAVNRWTLTAPAMAGDSPATRRMVRSIATETAIVLLIFAVAAGWRFTPPPRALAAAAAEPASEYIHTEKALAFIQITPGRAGEVDASINVLTGAFDILDAKEVTLVLSKPDSGVEPFRRAMVRRGESNWRGDDLTIPLAGTWRVRVDILISDFEMARLVGQISIRP